LAIAKDYGSGDLGPHPGLELFEELAELLDLVVGQIHGVQAVFPTAAPIAAIALIVVLALREAPLQGSAREPAGAGAPAPGR
jgi:hypothetical protein